MAFFPNEIRHILKQKERRRITQAVADDPASSGRADRISRFTVDYPWLSPGVAIALAKGDYQPAQAKTIALEDLRSQYQQNPAKFGDFQDNNPRKRLKSWINEFDSYIRETKNGPTASDAFDPTMTNRLTQFQGISDTEVQQLRTAAKLALDSGDGLAMTAALGLIAKRSTGQGDPTQVAQEQRTGGLIGPAKWLGEHVADPILDTGTAVAMPITRTAAVAANTGIQGVAAALRIGANAQSVAAAPTTAAALGTNPEDQARQAMSQNAQGWQALSSAYDQHGILAPIIAIASQTEGGQAVKSLAEGQPVEFGSGYLPSPESPQAQSAAAAARHYSPFLVNGHAWTPGRATWSEVLPVDSPAFTVASGLTDAVVAWHADPAATGLRLLGEARRAVQGFETVDDAVGTVRQVERALTGSTDATTAEGWRLANASPEELATRKAQILDEMGVVNGRRPLLRGHDPVSWLYFKGDPLVTKLTEERDPWTIWNATGRKWSTELVGKVADSTENAATREILASELGLGVDKVPSYTDGFLLKPRPLTDLPTGEIDPADPDGAAHLADDFMVLSKASEADRQELFNNLVRAHGRGDRKAVVDMIFDAFRRSMIAAGAPEDKALELSRYTRQMWDDAQVWGLDADTGEHMPLNLINGDEVMQIEGPRNYAEKFRKTVPLPDPRAVKRLVASPEFGIVRTSGWAGTVGITDKAYSAWKVFKLARPAWTVKVIGDEQLRMAATGNLSLLFHPIQAVAIAVGNPQEGTFFGKSWYERLEGFGKKADPAVVEELTANRARLAEQLRADDPFISTQDVLKRLDAEYPVPKSIGAKASQKVREIKFNVGKMRTDITGATVDARRGVGGDYAKGLTGRFSDFSMSGDEGRKVYIGHFDAVDRTSEHWARGVVEDVARLGSDWMTKRAMRLSPQEFADEMWSSETGKYLREQMAADSKPGEPWYKVLHDRQWSDAYAKEFTRHLEEFISNDDSLRMALVNGKLDGVDLIDQSGRANPLAMAKAEEMRATGRGPNYVKVERTVTLSTAERERDIKQWNSGINSLFDALMTRPSNYLSRHPTFMQKYWGDVPQMAQGMSAEARTQLLANLDRANLPKNLETEVAGALTRATGTEGISLQEADAILKRRALDFTRGTLYDLSKKSNMMDTLRFVFPFGEAFKEVLSVWAKIAVENPQTLRRAQQGIQGAREAQFNPITGLPTGDSDPMGTGFWRQDPQTGQEVFTLPGSGWLSRIATGGVTMPLKSPVQGLNMVGSLSPGFGMVVSIPASFLLPDKPQWDGIRKILFPYGQSSSNPMEIPGTEFAPTWMKHLAKFFSSPQSDRLFANTVMDIAAAKASTGEYGTSGNPMSHDEMTRLIKDSIKATSGAYLVRALAAASAPSAPGFDVYVKEHPDDPNLILLQKAKDELRTMQDKHGYDEGFKKFINKFGVDNLFATTVKSHSNVAGLTTSTEQRNWARSNQDLVDSLPETWALFAPEGKGHDQSAYEAQLSSNQRTATATNPRTPLEEANDTMGRSIVQNFIDTTLGGSVDTAGERQQLRDLKAKLAVEYDGYNPEFQGGGQTQARIRELERAVENPKIKDTDLGFALRDYFTQRDTINQAARDRGYSEVGAMGGEKSAKLRDNLRSYVKHTIIPNVPEFKRMWELVLSRELED